MADDLKKSDLVRLKSGGPDMVIDNIDSTVPGGAANRAQCSWFEQVKGARVRKQEWFELTSLVKVNESEGESAFYPGSSIMG